MLIKVKGGLVGEVLQNQWRREKGLAKHLTQCFVNLRGERPTPQPLTKLTLDHVKRRFDV